MLPQNPDDCDDGAARFVVQRLLHGGLQRAHLMAQVVSPPDAPFEEHGATTPAQASKRPGEDGEDAKSAKRDEACRKVQAVARGRQVRQHKELLAKSSVTIQRAFRRVRPRWLEGSRPNVAAVLQVVGGQRKEWAKEFQRAAGHGGLQKPGFLQALSSSCGEKASRAQAEKLWAGFLEQSEVGDPMMLPTFWAICEAVLDGDAHAAEFAGMAEEEYRSYSSDPEMSSEARTGRLYLRLETWVLFVFWGA